MIVDTSAIIAIFKKEPGFEEVVERLWRSQDNLMSAATFYETCAVLLGLYRTSKVLEELSDLVRGFGIRVASFTERDALLAAEAYQKFGKGFHPARLNLLDCVAYALARNRNDTLLFVGSDFVQTDVKGTLEKT
jgi:ribonuclease VapC